MVKNSKQIISLASSSLVIWIGLSGLIAISQKYQNELPMSHYPHIPAFIESYCFAILVTCVFLLINKNKSKKIFMFIICTIGCANISSSILYANEYAKQTQIYKELPAAYCDAIHAGLLDDIEKDDTIIIDINYSPTIYPNHFAQYAKRKVDAERMDVFMQELTDAYGESSFEYEPSDNMYITKCFLSDTQRVVYLSKISKIYKKNKEMYIEVSDIKAWCDADGREEYY